MTYRADIDGLRAIAVLAVVIFHLGVPGFEGGFVGVDVFFVISGYLISSLILAGTERGDFYLATFYRRRLQRLAPPLLATILATLVIALLILMPADFQSLARSAAAAALSLSNVLFWTEAGYWDTASELKPLLHTWSLGVEEQFYLVWPSLLLLAWAAGGRLGTTVLFAVTAIAGALFCVWFTGIDADAAFYLLPFRMFQFAAGALLIPALAALRNTPTLTLPVLRYSLLLLGLALIGYAILALDDSTPFPGTAALLPTAGAVMVIASGSLAGSSSALSRALLENQVMLWLGRASYALYLVHWPIVALYRYETGIHLDTGEQVSLALVTLLATAALHYGVERRFYRRATGGSDAGRAPALQSLPRLLSIMLSVAAVSLALSYPFGSSLRYGEPQLDADSITIAQQDRFANLRHSCRIANYPDHPRCQPSAGQTVLVFGNSHEPDALNFLKAGYDKLPLQFVMFGTTNRCGKIWLHEGRLRAADDGCQQRLDTLQDPAFLARVDWLVYAANRPFDSAPARYSKHEMVTVLRQVKQLRPELSIITYGGYINTDVDCALLINQHGDSRACGDPARVVYFAGSAGASQDYRSDILSLSDHYIDRVSLLCREKQLDNCVTETPGGTPAFFDRHHSSRPFARWSGKLYAQRHPELLTPSPDSRDVTRP